MPRPDVTRTVIEFGERFATEPRAWTTCGIALVDSFIYLASLGLQINRGDYA